MAKKPIKVLLLTNMYPSRTSYLGIFVKIQAQYLEQLGMKIIKVIKRGTGLPAYLAFLFRAARHLFFSDYDLIHAHYGFHSALLPALLHSPKKPLVITFHGSDALREPFRNSVYNALQRFVIGRADHIVAVSNQVRETIIQRLQGVPEKISVISCGVDTSHFVVRDQITARQKTGIAAKARVIFFAGKITLTKGLDVVRECAARMPDVLFLIAGKPEYTPRSANCRYIGLVQNRDMPLWLSAADLYFLPSRSEGSPVGILEALSCQRPVVVSDIGGCPDLVDDGETGYLVRVDNPIPPGVKPPLELIYSYTIPEEQLVIIIKRLRTILENRKLWAVMGQRGRQKVTGNFDNTIIAEKIRQVYTRITSE